MYGIFAYIWLIFMVNVGKYTSPMDPLGYVNKCILSMWFSGQLPSPGALEGCDRHGCLIAMVFRTQGALREPGMAGHEGAVLDIYVE